MFQLLDWVEARVISPKLRRSKTRCCLVATTTSSSVLNMVLDAWHVALPAIGMTSGESRARLTHWANPPVLRNPHLQPHRIPNLPWRKSLRRCCRMRSLLCR